MVYKKNIRIGLLMEFTREIVLGLFVVGILSFSSSSFASVNPEVMAEVNIEYVDFLNHYYPGLELTVSTDPAAQGAVRRELEVLERMLRGEPILHDGHFKKIACPYCGTKDGCGAPKYC